MDQTISKLSEFLQSRKSIAIVTPKDPNLDQMAASLSLFLSLESSGRQVAIATPNNPLVELSHLVGIDRVKTSLGGGSGDLTVSFPYKEGEIEKVSYTLENGFLNIVVKAGEAGFSFDQKDVKYTRPTSGPELLFIIGASRLSDLGDLFDPELLKNTTVVNIDNSSQNQGFGDLVLVSTKLSSVSEEIANIILNLNLPMDADVSQNLLDGLRSATNNFQNPNTSSLAFEMAGILMRSGARRESVVREMASSAFNQSQAQNLQGLYGEKPIQFQNQNPVSSEAGSRPAGQNSPIRHPSTPLGAGAQGEPIQKPIGQSQQPTPASFQGSYEDNKKNDDLNNPPSDWLTPKIYKGSTNF